MKIWILPAFAAFLVWGFWGFLPKLTTRYLDPRSAIVYEVLGGVLLLAIGSVTLNIQLEFHPKGAALAIATGTLGFLGAFFFLVAVSRGPVTLVAPVSALYPIVSIMLAVVFLHEPITLKQGLGLLLAILAITLIAI